MSDSVQSDIQDGDYLIEMIKAQRQGMTIECQGRYSASWNKKQHIGWDTTYWKYRIKPRQPKEIWIHKDDVLKFTEIDWCILNKAEFVPFKEVLSE